MSSSDEIILTDLEHLPIWVGWREVQRNGRATKVPFDPRTGEEAKSTDPTTWATRGEAESWAIFSDRGGVGIVLSQINGGDCCLCGIDLDTCRDPKTEIFQDWAQEVIGRLKTYTEVSPSGTGAKLFFTHASSDLPAIEKLFDGKGGRQFKNGGGEHCPAIEVYRTGRYFTVTDESIGSTDIIRQAPLADIEWIIREAGPAFAHKESEKSESSGNDQSRSGKAFRKGVALKAADYSYAAMRDALLADADPEIAEWAKTKGLANGEREMHRIYDNAGNAGTRPNGEDSSFNPIVAKPYIHRDPRSIPPRQFLHAGHYIRGFLSATIAPGGLGKTSLQLVEAVGMATSRDLLK
jgi:putative DNA primase/helicase